LAITAYDLEPQAHGASQQKSADDPPFAQQ
jgi:hypothetical protein